MLAFLFKTVFEILFGGYATPTKCVAFWRLALNSYDKIKLIIVYFFLERRNCNLYAVNMTYGRKQNAAHW